MKLLIIATLLFNFALAPLSAGAQTVTEEIDDAYIQKLLTDGDVETFDKLIAAGLDINSYDRHGDTMLFYTLTHNADLKFTKHLIESGADVNLPSGSGLTPIILAVGITPEFCAQNPNAYAIADNSAAASSPEMTFQLERAKQILQILIDSGADINQETPFGTPLMRAVTHDCNEEIVDMLLAAGAKVNQPDRQGRTALFYSAAFGADNITTKLLKAGADIHIRDAYGMSYMEVDKKTLLGK